MAVTTAVAEAAAAVVFFDSENCVALELFPFSSSFFNCTELTNQAGNEQKTPESIENNDV